MIKTLALVALAVTAVSLPQRKPSTGYVVGFVQDTNCGPLPRVTVSVGGSGKNEALTDAQGRFVIAVPDGRDRVDITARVTGFLFFTRTGVSLRPGARDSHTLTLDSINVPFVDPVIGTPDQVVTPYTPAPKNARLHGEVLTTACMPIDDAKLSVYSNGAEIVASVNAAGHFVFPDLPAGTYTLQVRALGYIPLARRATKVGRDDTRAVRVLLERGDAGEHDYLAEK
jgi:Carboxypeptidase regulatory-like domain